MHSLSPSNWQLLFLNQWKGENGCRNYFMTKLHERMLPDVRIKPVRIPGGRGSVRATVLGLMERDFLPDKWAATWQNQQSGCAPSDDSDQPGHPPSLIRVFAVRMKKAQVLSYPLSAQPRLIRLGGRQGWSESSLGAQPLSWFCHVAT